MQTALHAAFDKLSAGDLDAGEAEARRLLDSGSKPIRTQAHLLSAIARWRSGDVEGARILLEAVRGDADKEVLAMLAICHIKDSHIAEAVECMNEAVRLERGKHGYLTHDLLFTYLQGCRLARAWNEFQKYAEIFVDTYASLAVTDTTYLAIREVPPFEAFVDEVSAAIEAGMTPKDERRWRHLESHVDSEGQEYLQKFMTLCGWRSADSK